MGGRWERHRGDKHFPNKEPTTVPVLTLWSSFASNHSFRNCTPSFLFKTNIGVNISPWTNSFIFRCKYLGCWHCHIRESPPPPSLHLLTFLCTNSFAQPVQLLSWIKLLLVSPLPQMFPSSVVVPVLFVYSTKRQCLQHMQCIEVVFFCSIFAVCCYMYSQLMYMLIYEQ